MLRIYLFCYIKKLFVATCCKYFYSVTPNNLLHRKTMEAYCFSCKRTFQTKILVLVEINKMD